MCGARVNGGSVVLRGRAHQLGHRPLGRFGRRFGGGTPTTGIRSRFDHFGALQVSNGFDSSATSPFHGVVGTGPATAANTLAARASLESFPLFVLNDDEPIELQDDDQRIFAGKENVHVANDFIVNDKKKSEGEEGRIL